MVELAIPEQKKGINAARIKTTIIIDTPFFLLFYAQQIFAR
jgi:hypothetical protein